MMLFGFAGIAAIVGLIFAAMVLVTIAGAALLVILITAVILHR